MGMESPDTTTAISAAPRHNWLWIGLTLAAALVGVGLIADNIRSNSATYDEVGYLRVATSWWRTGNQEAIARMASPLTFWKLQQTPTLWLLDHTGYGSMIDDPVTHQRQLLILVRLGALWVWAAALLITVGWSGYWYGPRAMALAAWIFALSPNLIAHGALVTMEIPLVASSAACFLLYWRYLETRKLTWLVASAAAAGLAFSCKFTAVLLPPMLAAVDGLSLLISTKGRNSFRSATQAASRLMLFAAIFVVADLAITGFAMIPLSPNHGEHPSIDRLIRWVGPKLAYQIYETPLPQDWVAFAKQTTMQISGGPSYLFGEIRMKGWWYYYFVALAVKLPLAFWWLFIARLVLRSPVMTTEKPQAYLKPLILALMAIFLTITAVGSSRNYGVRYLLPLAPLAIVWISALAENFRPRMSRAAIAIGLGGYAVAVASIHPYELTYFNTLAGGPIGGRHILADSNLDWGQGLTSLARIQAARPELRDLTLYYFGDTNPALYGVVGTTYILNAHDDHSGLPRPESAGTRFVAVSATLQYGPSGPLGFFRSFNEREPELFSDDKTIAIYRTAERLSFTRDQ